MLRFLMVSLFSFVVALPGRADDGNASATTAAEDAWASWVDLITIQYREALDLIMRYQEKRYNIRFHGPPPKVIFVPGYSALARYIASQETMLIDSRFLECPVQRLLSDLHLKENPLRYGSCHLKELRQVLAHELGHHYVWLRLKQLPRRSWLSPLPVGEERDDEYRYSTGVAEDLVNEGIAEHFGSVFDREKLLFRPEEWRRPYPKEILRQDIYNHLVYAGGEALVRPILDTLGVDRGIKWLMRNPLTFRLPDISPVYRYQRRALVSKR